MKVLVTGSRGMLGTDLMQMLPAQHDVLGCDLHNCNVLDSDQFEQIISSYTPDVIIHAAAYTNVDQAETDQEAASLLNETGTKYVATAARQAQARLIYISTDYVFDGTKTTPYTEKDLPNPLGVYGKTKLRGEQQIQQVFHDLTDRYAIVRTAWLYGKHGKSFVSAILQQAHQKPVLQVVNDQIGSPTYTRDLVRGIMALLDHEVSGIVHLTNSGICTWYEFARAILELAQMSHIRVQPISTAELQRPAPRPRFSVLDMSKFTTSTGHHIPDWRQGLQEYFEEIMRNEE
jgi:dTDP-4-dehydrorhamnose reductase